MNVINFKKPVDDMEKVWANMPKILELLKLKAHLARQSYIFLKECGFTTQEALVLCLKMTQE